MGKRFKINVAIEAVDETEFALKEYYQSWRSGNQKQKMPFLALYNSFKENHLRDLDGGPLKLYLFFAFAANNDHGHSWHSISNIANFFDTQTRTVDNWIKVLVEKELVYREQKGKKSHTTYLIPYNDAFIQHEKLTKRVEDNQKVLDDLIVRLQELEGVYGEILNVFQLFQWGTDRKGRPDTKKNSKQELLIITKRKNGILIGHLYRLMKSQHLSIDEISIEETSVFDSPFTYNEKTVTGFALEHDIDINSYNGSDEMMSLLKNLAVMEEWKIGELPQVEYGEKDVFFPPTEEVLEEHDAT
ncbi:hypothetical protein [Bacillus toyonensis]|uniref:hypothetical protein n=1 Tax=Bacillus toyonensis TaxID=155322 RepID=UPI000BFB1AE9|nr:hypothetical protein [Bacillus toyonensis]PHE23618.1 hypothetical protein COF73_29275 [Bacillus toyonensis]